MLGKTNSAFALTFQVKKMYINNRKLMREKYEGKYCFYRQFLETE